MEEKMEENENENNNGSYLTFRIRNELFAANVLNVVNIQELNRITKVPNSPEYFMGVMNLRGKVLPVVDTKKKLHLGDSDNTENSCILVMELTNQTSRPQIGMLVDGVDEVIEINRQQVQAPPIFDNSLLSNVVCGLCLHGTSDKYILILDINNLLNSGELDYLKINSEQVPALD
jgi:purine-binding chemotaxis protein CheW